MATRFSRRRFVRALSTSAACGALRRLAPAWAADPLAGPAARLTGPEVDLTIRQQRIDIAGGVGSAITVNDSLPAPLLHFREGEDVTIRVTNLVEDVAGSIHWHGLLVPWDMDGVPGVSFEGILPGKTFTYRFRLRQSGTYWYHSHSGFQEQSGLYGPLVIEPARPEPVAYDREHVVLLSDWTFEDPGDVFAKIKKKPTYYNLQQRTLGDFFRDVGQHGLRETLGERAMWGRMRMSATDILDVTGATYTYLLNGLSPELNWTGLFEPGQRVRLRFINAGAMTIFDVRIPGLEMTVVQADGQNVEPVVVDEFRMGAAETMDVIVQPQEARAYAVFAEAMDRSGYASGTLAPEPGMRAVLPERRERPLRTMADMGMAHGDGHGGHVETGPAQPHGMHGQHASAGEGAGRDASGGSPEHGVHAGHGSGAGAPATATADNSALPEPARHGPDHHGPGNAAVAELSRPRVGEPGTGLEDMPWRVLVYTDLRRLEPDEPPLEPQREIELHLTGNMERQMWSINGKKFSEDPTPIPLEPGQRTRFLLVNDTMMDHPMHIHGMWMILENGHGARRPFKHTILVKAGERLAFDVKPDEVGPFVFHCHLLFHMELGMFRIVRVAGDAPRATPHAAHGGPGGRP